MNKILLSILFVLSSLSCACAWDKDTYSQYLLTAGSATIFTGSGYVKGIALSSSAAAHTYGSTYLVAYDSVTVANANVTAMTSASEIMLPRLYTSTPTANIDMGINTPYWYPEPGLFVANGLFVYKNESTQRAVIYYKR